jgi:phage gpG-like protein
MQFNEARKLANHLKKFESQISDMVTIMGVEAKNHFTKSFNDGGFTDETLEAWTPRKRTREKSGRAILVKTGRLKRSLINRKKGKYSTVINTSLPYAKRHNEGIKMPKRQFIGNSGKLNRKIISRIKSKINIIFA